MGVHERERANGRSVYQISFYVDGKPVFETVGTDYRVAQRLEKQRVREVAAGTYVRKGKSSGSTTLLDYAADWFGGRGNRNKKNEAQLMRDHILPRVGKVKLQELTRDDVRALVKALVAEDQTMSIKTAKNAFGVFRTMMQEALDSDLIARDPCGRLPRGTWPSDSTAGTKGKQKREIYPRDEVVRLTTSELLPLGVRVLITIFFYTAAREGEVCGLTWRQWARDSLPLGALAIDWAYDHKPLKQEEQPRRVPVHPMLAETLDWWWREGFALTYGRAPRLDDFIVPRLAAGRWNKARILGAKSECHTKSSCYKAFSRACVKLNIECRSLHSTRHTAITAARRGDQTGALKAPLERVTHNVKGEIIDCYTHWEWEPLCRSILAIVYIAAAPQVDEPAPSVPAALPPAPSITPSEGDIVAFIVASATSREIIDEFGGGAGNRTRGTHHEFPRRTAIARVDPLSGHPPHSRQIVQVDARLATRQGSVEGAARNYLEIGSDGEPCAHLALQLAAGVMNAPIVQMAIAVLAGGPHVHTRATELASLIISRTAPELRAVASLADARKRRDEGGGK